MRVLDLLFPKYCVSCRKIGSYICDKCFAYISFDTETICVVCNRGAIDGITHPNCKSKFSLDGAVSSIVYKGVVKKLIYNFKYQPYVSDLSQVLVDLFYEGIIQKEPIAKIAKENILLIPIPLHKEKLRKRGYNQAKILAEGLGKKMSIPVAEVLIRVKNTPTQVGLQRDKRKENIVNAFALKKNVQNLLADKIVFLVDDIMTSGSTFSEAAKILKKAGAKAVWGVALAKE